MSALRRLPVAAAPGALLLPSLPATFRDDVGGEPLSRQRYADDTQLVTGAALRAGASRVFEIGSLGAPGISDVDLLVCFPDDLPWRRLDPALLRLLGSLPPTFLHPPWVMRERHVADLPALFAFRRLQDVTTGHELLPQQTRTQRILWNVDACCAVLAALTLRTGCVSARSALCLLHGIRYNVELAAADAVTAAHGERLTTGIRALRDTWFTLPAPTRLRQLAALWQLGPRVLRELLDGYATLLGARHDLSPSGRGELRAAGSSAVWVFDDEAPARRERWSGVRLPQRLGGLFRTMAESGLEPWLQWRSRDVPVAAGAAAGAAESDFLAEVRAVACANACYVGDVVSCAGPFLPLAGGALAHVRRRNGWIARAGRAGRRLGRGARRLVVAGLGTGRR